MSGVGVDVGEDDEQAGLVRVGDPELPPRQDPVISALDGAGGEREGIATRPSFRQRIGPDRAAGQLGQEPVLEVLGAPSQECVDHEGVLNIDEHGHRGIDSRELLDGDQRQKEVCAGPTIRFRDLDRHHAEVEQLVDEGLGDRRLLIHFSDERRDLRFRKRADVGAEELFVLGQAAERRRELCDFGHDDKQYGTARVAMVS